MYEEYGRTLIHASVHYTIEKPPRPCIKICEFPISSFVYHDSGVEDLALQGFYVSDLPDSNLVTQTHTDSQLHDLAGNAWLVLVSNKTQNNIQIQLQ